MFRDYDLAIILTSEVPVLYDRVAVSLVGRLASVFNRQSLICHYACMFIFFATTSW